MQKRVHDPIYTYDLAARMQSGSDPAVGWEIQGCCIPHKKDQRKHGSESGTLIVVQGPSKMRKSAECADSEKLDLASLLFCAETMLLEQEEGPAAPAASASKPPLGPVFSTPAATVTANTDGKKRSASKDDESYKLLFGDYVTPPPKWKLRWMIKQIDNKLRDRKLDRETRKRYIQEVSYLDDMFAELYSVDDTDDEGRNCYEETCKNPLVQPLTDAEMLVLVPSFEDVSGTKLDYRSEGCNDKMTHLLPPKMWLSSEAYKLLYLSGYTAKEGAQHAGDYAGWIRDMGDFSHARCAQMCGMGQPAEDIPPSVSMLFVYPRQVIHHTSQIIELHRLYSLVLSASSYLRFQRMQVDVHSLEIALSIVHRVVFSKRFAPWFPASVQSRGNPRCYMVGASRHTAGCCLGIAIKFGQRCEAPMKEIWQWAEDTGSMMLCMPAVMKNQKEIENSMIMVGMHWFVC